MGRYKPETALELDSFKWMKEVESRGTFDITDLLAEPINRIFPCVACNDQKNILDRSTWFPAFLRKSSATTWDVLNVDFNHVVHDLEWEKDDGLENLWGLYYKFSDAQFIQSFKSPSTTKECMVLAAHPISDDATTAATTFSSSMTSLTPGTSTTTSSTGALIEYNQDFQNALVKHRNDILCLVRKTALHGKPAIPTKMIGKIREANLATMALINKEASRHGGKELSLRKMKELGAQAENEATIFFSAETKQIHMMEQDDLPLENAQLQPPVPTFTTQWAPNLPPGFRVAQMELDGNCFYRSVSDQLFHDQGNGHVIVRHQINNHIRRNGEKFKHFLLLNDSNLELTDLEQYIERMGQDGAWAGHPKIYAAAMCYKVDVTIYSRDYTEIGGSLVFTDSGATEVVRDPPMIYISYHDNNHFNSVRPPISSQPTGPVFLTGMERLEADMERAIKDHQDEVGQAISINATENGPTLPEEKIKPIRENSRKIMSYIAHQLSSADGRCVTEAQLKESRDQADARALGTAQKDADAAPTPPSDPSLIRAHSPLQGMVAQYEADLKNIISNHRDGIASILREVSPTNENSTILAPRYDELRSNNFPIMTALANLILHLGGKEIPHAALSIFADRAEEEALLLYKSAAPMVLPPKSSLETAAMVIREIISPNTQDDESLVLPPTKPKASLKPSKFFPVFAEQTPPRRADAHMKDDEDDVSEPGVCSKLDEGVGDGMHFITASFVKTNEKIKDQLLTQVRYFMDLMCANIDGVKFHPLSTERSLPILKLSADKTTRQQAPRLGIIFTSKTNILSSQEHVINQRYLPKKWTLPGDSNLMKTGYTMAQIGSLE